MGKPIISLDHMKCWKISRFLLYWRHKKNDSPVLREIVYWVWDGQKLVKLGSPFEPDGDDLDGKFELENIQRTIVQKIISWLVYCHFAMN